MQLVAGVWRVRFYDIHVEFNTQARLFGRNDEAVFPLDRFLEDFRMKTLPGQDAFLDQEVWRGSSELDAGSRTNRSVVEMRCNLGVIRFCHSSNFLCFQNAADTAQIHLEYRSSTSVQQIKELVFCSQAFTRRNRNAGLA